ncbi:MAG: YHS domain-containing protein [Chloroflexi bacterium]|nr:YHS domain-containing protein [Chloroflexota bacterium]OJV92186.1 MAG: YHS domain-containing protein [Chloroflexi bacterium 54-19]
MAIDPVCQMEVDTLSAKYISEHNGATFYFCAPGCKLDFEEEPEAYLTEDNQYHNHSEGHRHQS